MITSGARGTPRKPMPPPEDKLASPPQRDLCEASLAALHELSERLTAATNYLAAALRLCETESVTQRCSRVIPRSSKGRSVRSAKPTRN